MVLASDSIDVPVFRFLASTLGQLVIALAGILLVVLAKGVVRPTQKPAFQRDDFAFGIDLSILAIITVFSSSVAEFVSGIRASARNDLEASRLADGERISLLL